MKFLPVESFQRGTTPYHSGNKQASGNLDTKSYQRAFLTNVNQNVLIHVCLVIINPSFPDERQGGCAVPKHPTRFHWPHGEGGFTQGGIAGVGTRGVGTVNTPRVWVKDRPIGCKPHIMICKKKTRNGIENLEIKHKKFISQPKTGFLSPSLAASCADTDC